MIKNNTSTVNYKSEMVFNNFVNFEEDKVLLKDYTPKEIAMFFYLIEPPEIKIVYEMSDPVCECGNKLHKHNIIEWNMDKKYHIYKYQYKCPECNKTIITPLEGIVDKGCCYTTDFKDMVVNLYSKEHISYANSSNFINEQYDLNISRQTTYNFNDKYSDSYLAEKEELIEEKLKEENIEPTGFPGHDETFLKINGEKYALLTMLDSNNQSIINDQLMPEEEYRDFLETFIIYSQKDLSIYNDPKTPNPINHLSLPDFKKNTLIGDGLKEYPAIAKKANMEFHPCVFHKIMNQRTPVWKKQKRLERKLKTNKDKIEKNKEKINEYNEKYKGQGKIRKSDKIRRKQKDKVKNKKRENIKLRTKNKQLKKEIDEYENYNKRISEIFEQKTIKNAKTRFKLLYNQIKFLPDEIAKFIRNLARDIDKTLKYIENKNIPKTNNWLELFFKIIFPKKYRKRFKTKKGVKKFLRSGKIKWNENIILKEKIKIKRNNIWSKLKQNINQNHTLKIS